MFRAKNLIVLLLCGILGEMTWSLAQQSKSPQLTLQDYEEIRLLYAKYAFAFDSDNAEGVAGLFTREDGSVSFYKGAGHDALVTMMNTNPPAEIRRGVLRRHLNTNLVITPTKEGADGQCYLLAVNVGTAPPSILSASQYRDKLVKTADGWKFRTRLVLSDSPPAGAFAREAAGNAAK